MIFFERHLQNINSLILSNKIFSSVYHFSGSLFCKGFKFCVDYCNNICVLPDQQPSWWLQQDVQRAVSDILEVTVCARNDVVVGACSDRPQQTAELVLVAGRIYTAGPTDVRSLHGAPCVHGVLLVQYAERRADDDQPGHHELHRLDGCLVCDEHCLHADDRDSVHEFREDVFDGKWKQEEGCSKRRGNACRWREKRVFEDL